MKNNFRHRVGRVECVVYLWSQTNTHTMILTTSLSHYKALIAKGVSAKLVTKSDLN